MRFDELQTGQVFHNGTVSLKESEMIDFALLWDPQPFHMDPARARASPWGGIIASGWQTSGVAMRLFCQCVLAGSEAMGSPGINFIRFPKPVRPGDALSLQATVLKHRKSESKSELGIVLWRWQLFNQLQEEVYTSEGTVFFDLSVAHSIGPGSA